MTHFDVSIFGEDAKKIQEILGLHEEQEIFIDGKLAVKYRSIEGHSKIEIKIELTIVVSMLNSAKMCSIKGRGPYAGIILTVLRLVMSFGYLIRSSCTKFDLCQGRN